jgi:hypothetical protein
MKKIIALATIVFLASCGNSEKTNDLPKKMVKCDSIKETWFDSTGTEQLKAYVKCDTVLVEPEKKE